MKIEGAVEVDVAKLADKLATCPNHAKELLAELVQIVGVGPAAAVKYGKLVGVGAGHRRASKLGTFLRGLAYGIEVGA